MRDRLIAGKFLPTRARRNSDHPAAGSPLFRRWLSLLRRYGNRVDAIWIESYDKFAADVSPFDPALKIVPIDSELPIGPDNFSWATSREAVEKTHGKGQIVFGRHFDSLTAIALAFNIKVSTLKYRVFVSGMTFERAVSTPLGETSFRTSGTEIVVDGVVFRSKRQAILHIAKTREISEGVAKYGLSIGRFV